MKENEYNKKLIETLTRRFMKKAKENIKETDDKEALIEWAFREGCVSLFTSIERSLIASSKKIKKAW